MISLELLNKVTDEVSLDQSGESDELLPVKVLVQSKLSCANIILARDKGLFVKDPSIVACLLVITQMSFIVGYTARKEEENARAETHSHVPSE